MFPEKRENPYLESVFAKCFETPCRNIFMEENAAAIADALIIFGLAQEDGRKRAAGRGRRIIPEADQALPLFS